MDLTLDISVAEGYSSKSQIARVLTERWVKTNAYCPSCGNEKLSPFANNLPVADFFCSNCKSEYELKSSKNVLLKKIVNGAYKTMMDRINSENNPNLFFLNYSKLDMIVENFLVIPKYYFNDGLIEKRQPLGLHAKRSGWVGCNILLNNIPEYGKIYFIKNRMIKPREHVVMEWAKTSFLANHGKEVRGWTIEIMRLIDRIHKQDFTLQDMYFFKPELERIFPDNNFIEDKIRQQLQLLRDRGVIIFRGKGKYSKV